MSEPIMQKIVARPKVNRDSSVKAAISIPQPVNNGELEKKTVRISGEAIAYYAELKNTQKITLDGMLEAIALYAKQNPEVEQDLIAIGKQILKTRQDSANAARAATMYEKYRPS